MSLLYPKQKSSAHLPKPSQKPTEAGRVSAGRGSCRLLWTTVVDELPSGHSKGGGFSSAALGGSVALPSGTDPRTGQRAPTQEPALQKGEKCFCPGVLSSPCPGLPVPGLSCFRVAGSPALPLRVPVCFLFRLMFLSTGRGRHVPAPSGRDVGSNAGAPTQEPALSRYPLYAVRFNLDFAYKRTSAWWFSSCSSPSFSSSLCKPRVSHRT